MTDTYICGIYDYMKKRTIALIAILTVVLLAVGGIALAFSMTSRTAVGNKNPNPAPFTINIEASKLEELINEERVKAGLKPLLHSDKLVQSACGKLDDMVSKKYYAHIAPDGTQPWYFFREAKYDYKVAGENLAYGFNSAEDMVKGWMNSPSHKKNILGDFSEQGICVKNVNFQSSDVAFPTVNHFGTPATAQ